MMQKEIKKRAQLYGIAAILSAIVLVTVCYNFGVGPLDFHPSQSLGMLKTFSSYSELRSFIKTNSGMQYDFPFYSNRFFPITLSPGAQGLVFLDGSSSKDYSTTNIQVAGVDEADIVKTDGTYLYLVSNNTVFIIKAYPPEEAEVLSKITFAVGDVPVGIFISQDSNRLAVLGSVYGASIRYLYYYDEVKTFVNVYDISNKTNPVLSRQFMMSGGYFNSRMIGDYVYAVITQPVYMIYDTLILPKVYSKGGIEEIQPYQIYYYNFSDTYYTFTTVLALNMQNAEETPTNMTIMLGGTSNMYVSLNNIYITFPEPEGQTSLYRIRIENSTLSGEAQGNVPGSAVNQFSMDEYNDTFRIATTTRLNGTSQNNLYVLDMNLSLVGSLENVAPGEAIDSVRFIGNRCYFATSVVQRDPFFVIDVENPSAPEILGYLKIPGFTRYLHPYDEDHIIGVGKDGSAVKVSLFDVSNVSSPIEIDKYEVSGDWTDTPVLTDHKAFLFSKANDLLAFPVSVYVYDAYQSWQGVYVLNITLTDGLVLRGIVKHADTSDGYYWVNRAFYIENVLYTVSDIKVKMNSLEDLAFIDEVLLS